ncbi:hypothetical protein RRG08_041020 [Elysia crispata]|uniref:Uncharacterized protein n=1 Tax=Elysia crispata TaxID=231223 RepID=A0AAE1EE26_9GAST|nr:hypothetical protein RRG08_041020 [Elysia crispata]
MANALTPRPPPLLTKKRQGRAHAGSYLNRPERAAMSVHQATLAGHLRSACTCCPRILQGLTFITSPWVHIGYQYNFGHSLLRETPMSGDNPACTGALIILYPCVTRPLPCSGLDKHARPKATH